MMNRRHLACFFLLLAATTQAQTVPPGPAREFRGVWVATVANIDWPSSPHLSSEAQQQEFRELLDRAVRVNLNAIVLQVRPAADALYPSQLEPWSEYLTGQMGKAPKPAYDPLAFAVTESHRRGLELHAWFNPFRARHPAGNGPVDKRHISQQHPELVREYGKYLWLDPGEQDAINHSLAVIADVVDRYDIDGVHLDDYFYPYPIKDENGDPVPFPDDPSWNQYSLRTAWIPRNDWRRWNVNSFIKRLYFQTKTAKPWVKVGISPFGIWRPGHPKSIEGFDAYDQLYADAKTWLRKGWLDYVAPQLYWTIDSPAQSYPILLEWWTEQNEQGRHLWPGNYTSRLGMEKAWPVGELLNQIVVTRNRTEATGNVHFSMKAFMKDYGGIVDAISNGPYATAALPPASPWLGDNPPDPPSLEHYERSDGMLRITLKPANPQLWQYCVQHPKDDGWHAQVIGRDEWELSVKCAPTVPAVWLSTISRTGILSTPLKLELTAE